MFVQNLTMMRYSLTLVFSLVFGMICSQSSSQLDQVISKGRELRKRGNYDRSITVFKNGLEQSKTRSNKNYQAKFELHIGISEWYLGNMESAYQHFETILSFDTTSITAADAMHNKGILIQALQKNTDPIVYFEKSVKIFRENNEIEKLGNTLLELGSTEREKALSISSLAHLIEAATIFKSLDKQDQLAQAYDGIGAVQELQYNYPEAKKYYTLAIRIFEARNEKEYQANMLNNLGTVYKNLNSIDSSIICFNKSIRIKKKLGLIDQLGASYHNLASTYFRDNQFSQAKKYFLLALENERGKDSTACSYAMNELGRIYIQEENYELAQRYLDSSDVFNTKNDVYALMRNLENKAFLFEKTDDYKSAYKAQSLYNELYKTTQNEYQTETIQGLQEQYNTEQKEQRIDNLKELSTSLSQENIEQSHTIEQQSEQIKLRNRWILIIGGITFLIVLLSVSLIQRNRLKEVKRRISMREKMQQKMGEDLHDSVQSDLSAVNMKVQSITDSSEEIEKTLGKVSSELLSISGQVRLISHRLSPIINKLETQDFTEVLENDFREFELFSELSVSAQIPESLNQLTIDQKNDLYGIIRESLNNVYQHAKASKVEVNFTIDKRHIRGIISDNGIGISSSQTNGIGLQNIHERSDKLRGKIKIESQDEGTQISITFPHKLVV